MKLSLFGRTEKTNENYLESELGKHFYTKDYLDGVMAQRAHIGRRQAKTGSALLVMTTFLAFFDAIAGNITFGSLSFGIFKSAASALSVVVSATLVSAVMTNLDQLLLDRLINAIGRKAGLFSLRVFLIDRYADQLWAEALVPKFFGLQSGLGHKIALAYAGLFGLIMYIFGMFYPTMICTWRFVLILKKEGNHNLEIFLSGFSVLMCVFAIGLIIVFLLKYEFAEADFEEVGGPYPRIFETVGRRPRREKRWR